MHSNNKMEMGSEVIADRGIWTAKKRYILNVHDNEGVRLAEPKLKMMGIETAKSSTPQWVRTKLTEAFKVVMSGTEQDLWEFVETARKEFRNLPPEEVAFPRGCKGLVQYQDLQISILRVHQFMSVVLCYTIINSRRRTSTDDMK